MYRPPTPAEDIPQDAHVLVDPIVFLCEQNHWQSLQIGQISQQLQALTSAVCNGVSTDDELAQQAELDELDEALQAELREAMQAELNEALQAELDAALHAKLALQA